MTKKIKITIVGASGRMGQMLARAVEESQDLEIAGLVEIEGHPLIGELANKSLQLRILEALRHPSLITMIHKQWPSNSRYPNLWEVTPPGWF